MKLGKRSHVSRGGIVAAGIAFAVLGAAAVVMRDDLGGAAWGFLAVAFLGVVALAAWKTHDSTGREEDHLLEVTEQAIRNEADRLEARRSEIEKVLMAYAEWMEFPDFNELRDVEWAVPGRSEQDAQVAALLDTEADSMLARFSSGDYWEDGRLRTRALLVDLYGFMEKIARVYQPGSDRPLLETNLEALLMAINRASLQVILLLEEIPLVEAKDLNLRRVAERVRQASKVVRKYEDLQPYLEPVRYLWQGSKFLLASNPLLAAGWIAGSELIWKGGKRIGKRAIDGYLLSLMRQTLGIIAWETATIYDRTHRYRNPDWVFAVELTHLVSVFPLHRDTLHHALKELGNIPLRSSYDRVFLYRCVAQHVSPKPDRFAQADLLTEETRLTIAERLLRFFHEHVEETTPGVTDSWSQGLAQRLEVPVNQGP
ncbi:MAG: hypothetical protein HKN82_04765 [Akkermansiaceae bacterium]|nr:hypothetical protein [Akkermansiaceae bacterium]